MTANGNKVSFWNDEGILKLDCSDGIQLSEYAKNNNSTELYSIKSMNYMINEAYLNLIILFKASFSPKNKRR